VFGLPGKELRGDDHVFARSRFAEHRLGTLKGGLRRHHQPALGYTSAAQLQTLIAGRVIKMLPGVPSEGLRDDLGDHTDRVGKRGDEAEFLEVGGIGLVVAF
jgi:hypothetical protein